MNTFITDNGQESPVTDVETGAVIMILPRYAGWVNGECVRCDNDLEALKREFKTTVVVKL